MNEATLEIVWDHWEPGMVGFHTTLMRKDEPSKTEIFFKEAKLREYLINLNVPLKSAREYIKRAKANGSVRVNLD